MSALRIMAVAAWTQLVNAMRADGLIDPAITKSGPATTAAIIDLVQATVPAEQRGPWLHMDIPPRSGRQVVALAHDGRLHVVQHETNGWFYAGSMAYCDPTLLRGYTFIDISGAPK